MIFNRIKIFNHFLLPKSKSLHNIRWKGFTHCEHEHLNLSKKYCREVLRKTDGCILFECSSSHHFDPNAGFIKNDEFILKLCELECSAKCKNGAKNEMFASLDMECMQRSANWSTEQKLFVLDIWHHNRHSIARFNSKFYQQTPRLYLKALKQLSKGPILQILYYVSCSKQQLQEDEEKSILRILHRDLSVLTLDEATLFYAVLVICNCQPRFEYAKTIRRMLANLIGKNDLRQEPETAVTYAVKAVRRLASNVHNSELEKLQSKLIPVAMEAQHYLLTHIAQLGVQQRVFNPILLSTVIERLIDFVRREPQVLRLKEVERSLLLIATFRFTECENIVAQYCEEVQHYLKQSLATKFPSSLVRCIGHLAIIGTAVDHELVDWALKYAAGSILAANSQNFLVIDSFAKINLHGAYDGHILSDRMCSELKSKCETVMPVGFHHDVQKNIVDIFQMNNHHVLLIEAVPHFNSPDFLFIYDTNRKITVEICDGRQCGSIVRASDLHRNGEAHLVTVALVTYTQRSLLCNDKRKIATGRFMMKMKQLELLGFKVVPWHIRSDEWKSISLDDKQNKLHKRLSIEHIDLFDVDAKL